MKTYLKAIAAVILGLAICTLFFNLTKTDTAPKVVPPVVLKNSLTNTQIFCMTGSYNLHDKTWHDEMILSPRNHQFLEKNELIMYLKTAPPSFILRTGEQETLRNDIIKLANYAGSKVTTKNKDDHKVTDYLYLYANAGQLYHVTFKDGCMFKAFQSTETGFESFKIEPNLMLSHKWQASPELLQKLNN